MLTKLCDEYGESRTEDAQLRALQRDLKQLHEDGSIIGYRQPGEGKTLRYKRLPRDDFNTDNSNLVELRINLQQLGHPPQLVEDILRRVRAPDSFFDLPANVKFSGERSESAAMLCLDWQCVGNSRSVENQRGAVSKRNMKRVLNRFGGNDGLLNERFGQSHHV